MDFDQAILACQRSTHNDDDGFCIKLVYGEAGIYEHFIKEHWNTYCISYGVKVVQYIK